MQLEVGTTGHLLGYVRLAYRPRGLIERRRNGELGIYSPSACEPAELIHGPLQCDVSIGVVGQGDLTDAWLVGAPSLIEHPPEFGTRLDRDHHVGVPPSQI